MSCAHVWCRIYARCAWCCTMSRRLLQLPRWAEVGFLVALWILVTWRIVSAR